jgi:uncharacterized protein YjbJ (UPF0337 family)
MRITKPGWRRSAPRAPDLGTEEQDPSAPGRTLGAVELARTSAATLIERAPGALRAMSAGVGGTTAALQSLPDSTLRWIAATSVGLGAGLRLAGAPRLVSAAGAAPALIVGAAIALRPTEPVVPAHEQAEESAGGAIDMSDEHTKGAISTAQGKVEEGLSKLTGDKEAQVHGKAKQVQGAAQKGLGDVQDAIRGPKERTSAG